MIRRPYGSSPGWRVSERTYCTDWQGNGHSNRYAASSSGATSGPRTEEEKAARRALVAANKAADVDVVVRRKFIRELVARAKVPGDGVLYAARVIEMGRAGYMSTRENGVAELLGEFLLGKDENSYTAAGKTAISEVASKRTTAYLVALAAAMAESKMPRDWHRSTYSVDVIEEHLRALASWGYDLSDLEQTWLAARKPARGKK